MRLTIILILFSLIQSYGQLPTAMEILNKSIAYHDPQNNWSKFRGSLSFYQINPASSIQKQRIIRLDNLNDYFEFTEIGNDTISRTLENNHCRHSINGNDNIDKDILFMRGLTCDRTKMYRDYYTYLYGLPMKLKDPGTIIDSRVQEIQYNGIQCLTFRVKYEAEVGKDTWDFFFDPKSYALVGYRFYHDVSKNDGEYIHLYDLANINGILFPKNRYWYTNQNNQFLGADILTTIPGSEKNYQDEELLARADSLRFTHWNNKKIFNLHVEPNWYNGSTDFWYIDYSTRGKTYLTRNVQDHESVPLFDHRRLVDLLEDSVEEKLYINNLPLTNLAIREDSMFFSINDKEFVFDLLRHQLNETESKPEPNEMEEISPDGQWTAFTRDYNLFLRSNKDSTIVRLSDDGNKDYAYGSYYGWFDKMEGENGNRPDRFNVSWSPDSRYLITRICDTRKADKMYMLDWSKADQFRPSLWSYYRGSPGDSTMVNYHLIIYNVESQKPISHNLPVTTHINSITHHWSKEGRLFLDLPYRGYKKRSIFELDLKKEKLTSLYTESSNTRLDYMNTWYTNETGLMFFTSEKTGWRQLYALNLETGAILQITHGQYFIHNVEYIDEEAEEIYYTASGKEEGYNPYWEQLYKVGYNGGEVVRLTPEKAHHEVSFSPDGNFFVDNYSTMTSPTTTVLRSTHDPQVMTTITRADVERIYQKGWVPPHPFEAIGRDGKTTIYGALWKPTDFDPKRKYPIIDHSYTGPHTQMYPRNFRASLARDNQALAELGFIVIMVDGMGTYGRSKAFHDVSYKNMGQNLLDHVLAIRQLSNRYSWIDTTRIGIFGHSAGGYDAAHSLLEFPDFYKVAVASSADHDFRMEKAWWPEMYMGWPVDSTYHDASNITMADRLKGKLLLVHGAMDDNVNASATFKLTEALVLADKEFDLLIFPSQRHGYQGKYAEYFIKKRWKYFLQHLRE